MPRATKPTQRDIEERYLHGEFYSADSISRPDTTRYHTRLGRVVYGGGGMYNSYLISSTHHKWYLPWWCMSSAIASAV